MVKTQVELPNARYQALQRVAREKRITIAQAMNRAVELLLKSPPPSEHEGRKGRTPEQRKGTTKDTKEWHPPQIKNVAWKNWTPEQLRDFAQETTTEAQLKRLRSHAVH